MFGHSHVVDYFFFLRSYGVFSNFLASRTVLHTFANIVSVAGNVDDTFLLELNSGLLSVTNRPRKNSYRLNIKASDKGAPPKFSSQILEISVADVHSGPPKFSQSVYKAGVMENSRSGALVTSVLAVKQGTTANLFYSLDDQLAFGLFTIDQRSGEVRTLRELDREERSEYILTVYVHDSATPPGRRVNQVILRRELSPNTAFLIL